MSDHKDSPKRTVAQIIGAAVTGMLIGVLGGAALGYGLPGVRISTGAIVGGVVMGLVSGWADATRVPGRPQPLWVRVMASVFLAAAIGGLFDVILPDMSLVVVGAVSGFVAGALGGRVRKLALGLVLGVVTGLVLQASTVGFGWSVVSAATVLIYRTIAGLLYRGREQVNFLAEGVTADEVPFVVPLVERQGYVGVDYLKRYAEGVGAVFERSPADIGILASFDDLAGPTFDPGSPHPLIREFYEHTSRFSLSITPEWRRWMRLPYLIYRETFAKPLGQANAPFQIEEVQRGVVSWIDTVDLDEDGVPDFRAWVRAYQDSNEPLYVGIYTVVRMGETGYVSVGFPLPAGSFTATLLPTIVRGDGLLLTSRQGDFQGHYLSVVDPDSGDVTVAKLESFAEEIEVYVVDGELRTDHRFYLGGINFMTLYYEITRN
ncbi:MAG: hypothetical protein WBZ45_11795 [Acidimicrobiia bacterium]